MSMSKKDFKAGLIAGIKVAGQMLIDNAEDFAGKTERMSGLDISINFDPEFRYLPEVTVSRTHLPKVEQLEFIFDEFDGKEKEV